MSRNIAEVVRDLQASRSAQNRYRDEARRLTMLAREFELAGRPLLSREAAHMAFIAENAARAEYFDPEVRP